MITLTKVAQLMDLTVQRYFTFASFAVQAGDAIVVFVQTGAIGAHVTSCSGGGLTWTRIELHDGTANSLFAYVAYAPAANPALSITIDQGGNYNRFFGIVEVAHTDAVGGYVSVRQHSISWGFPTGTSSGGVFQYRFPAALLAAGSYLIAAGTRNNAFALDVSPPSGWTEEGEIATGYFGLEVSGREGGETTDLFTFSYVGYGNEFTTLGIEFASAATPPAPLPEPSPGVESGTGCEGCSTASHDFTYGTFDLFLARLGDRGAVEGEDVLVGPNIVTGTWDDDSEPVEAFDPEGDFEEPMTVRVRRGLRLSFVLDQATCDNLQRFLDSPAAATSGGTRFSLGSVSRSQMYRATLEHTLPCGHVVTIRLHRVSVTSRPSWLFSPDSLHGFAVELRAFPDDHQADDERFGYVDVGSACTETS